MFRECLEEALYGETVFSDRIPWADLTEALEAIAAAPRPFLTMLIDRAWAVYRRHAAEPGEASSGANFIYPYTFDHG